MRYDRKDIKKLPHQPGIYTYFDEDGKLLYVGKAKDLVKRVSSYFQKSRIVPEKVQLLVDQIRSIEIIVVQSEIEAILLEAELIRQKQPKYNVILKDDRSFLYILFSEENFPRISAIRKSEISESSGGKAFGPFPSAHTVRTTLREIRKIFPYRSCTTRRFNKHIVCLYYHLNLCHGPCENFVSLTDYNDTINKLISFFERKTTFLIRNLTKEMNKLSKQEKYEEASNLRDRITKLTYLTSEFRLPEAYLQDPYLLTEEKSQTLEQLQVLLQLNTKPKRIECYDISNLQGKEATGSMVVFTNGEPDRKEYRRFKIRQLDSPNDFAMLQEMLSRRFKRRESTSWALPDLILIDGGRGQLSSILAVMRQFNIKTPVISLAKKKEEIYIPKDPSVVQVSFSKIVLSKKSKALQLLQHIRDESHRFAIQYHRTLRKMRLHELMV